MTQVFLLFLFLFVTDVTLGAPTQNEDQNDWRVEEEIIPIPVDDNKNPTLLDDIAISDISKRNADPCIFTGCKWPKSGRYVYVPYYISSDFTPEERNIILRGLKSFKQSTCIRFIPYRSEHKDFLHFYSGTSCSSRLGRQDGGQYISLERPRCVTNRTVQHEVLHALGFNHEQVRSDRDNYVKIFFQNIKPGKERNFKKKETNNLETPYDFFSVMEYSNYAFSSNGKKTIIAKSNPDLKIGQAKKMSATDVIRVNKLYKCWQ